MKKLVAGFVSLIFLISLSPANAGCYGKKLILNMGGLEETVQSMDSIANEISDEEGWRVKSALLAGELKTTVEQAKDMDVSGKAYKLHRRYLEAIDHFDEAAYDLRKGALDSDKQQALEGVQHFQDGQRAIGEFGKLFEQ